MSAGTALSTMTALLTARRDHAPDLEALLEGEDAATVALLLTAFAGALLDEQPPGVQDELLQALGLLGADVAMTPERTKR